MKKHKKTVKLFILIILSLSVIFIYKVTNKNNITYLSLGDGYSAGLNSYSIKEYGYSNFLKEYLEENDKLKSYKNYSNKLMSVKDLYNDILTNKQMQQNNKNQNIKSILRNSNIVTLSIGLNDLQYYDYLQSENSAIIVINNYKKLIKEIKKYYPHKIYVIGYNEKLVNQNSIKEFNNYLKNNKDIIYIETNKLSNLKTRKNPNSIYYDSIQYKEIATKIIKKLNKSLEI